VSTNNVPVVGGIMECPDSTGNPAHIKTGRSFTLERPSGATAYSLPTTTEEINEGSYSPSAQKRAIVEAVCARRKRKKLTKSLGQSKKKKKPVVGQVRSGLIPKGKHEFPGVKEL